MSKVVSNESYANYLTKSKKSFSLVELAIYIVAVGVLTGVAVGGMEVVNNAKVQKVMEEMDSYKTAMYLFQSTFGALPGNVTESLCKDTNEFNNLSAPGSTDAEGIYCATDTTGLTGAKSRTVASANETLLATETSQNSFLNSMRFLVASGIKSDAARTNLYSNPLGTGTEPDNDVAPTTYTRDVIKATQGISSYSADATYSYVGFSGSKDGMAMIRGLEKAGELSASSAVKKNISGKNVLVMYYNYASTPSGVFTPVMAKKLSLKVDNNTSPADGKLLAVRQGQVAAAATDETVCYSGSSFVNSKDATKGCNLIYVL
ncbi:MAG: hypothetical protein IJT15_03980 [Rickettsiales bacterium]|nr:hypothetical protein [Rickettsiales bacterium]